MILLFAGRKFARYFQAKNNLKKSQFSCTFPAQLCKLLKLNGAGEGNRTLV
jgi:hypothetical protein